MANRFPLTVNPATQAIEELAVGDGLDLSQSNIVNVGNVTVSGSIYSDRYFYANGASYTNSGPIGYTGSRGDTGLGFTIAKTYASVAALTADTSPTSITAGQFAIIETGNVSDAENSRLYLWSGTAYSYVSDLSGSQGITGASGAVGYTGSAGSNGTIGTDGATGPTGYTGSAGTSGSAGSNGATGPAGYTGSAGAVGTVGANTQVLFNDAGNISANASFTYSKTTGTMSVGTILPAVGNTMELWAWGYNVSGDLITGDTVYRTTPTLTQDTTEWKSFASSYNGMFAIKSDNTLWSWGNIPYTYNLNITTSSPVQIGTDQWKAVASGSEHNLGVKLDGTLWAWGIGSDGKLGLGDTSHRTSPVQVGALTTWSTVATQYNAGSYAIKTDGTIWAWGRGANYGFNGALGLGNAQNRSSPTQIGSDTNWVSVSGNNNQSGQVHAIKTNGTMWSWGLQGYAIGFYNPYGSNVSNPTQIGSDTNWAKVSAGYYASAAIKTNGTLWVWGYGDSGGLGLNSTGNSSTPVQVGALTDWANISVGYNRMVATKTDGTMWSWGKNNQGQLGDGTLINKSSPVQIGSGTYWLSAVALPLDSSTRTYAGAAYFGSLGTSGAKFKNIYAGTFTGAHSGSGAGLTGVVATTVSGSTQSNITAVGTLTSLNVAADVIPSTTALNHAMWGWGKIASGLGLPSSDTVNKSNPTQIGSSTKWVSLGIGWYGATAVQNDGTLWSWGNSILGRAGGTEVAQIGSATNWRQTDHGIQTAGAITTDGKLYTWGYSGYHGLGNTGNYADSVQQVGSATDWIYYRAGGSGALGIRGTTYGGGGALYTWGYNPYGALGLGNTTTISSPQQVGSQTDWKKAAMSFGDFFTVALKTDGTMWSWGYNGSGTLGTNNNVSRSSPAQIGALTTWVDVSVGDQHTLALKADGTVWSWGNGLWGKLGLGNTTYMSSPVQVGALTTWAGVAAGHLHSLAIKTDGSVWAWGKNSYGELGDGTLTDRSSPVQVGTGYNWSGIDAGYYISFALDKQNPSLGTSSSQFVNMYASGTVTAGSFSGSGAGLTGLSVSESISKSIDNQVAANVSSTMGSVLSLPSTAGFKYIVHSIYLTNIDPTFSANVAVSGNIAFSGGANVSIANKIPVPARGALELLREPQTLNPSDVINLQALNSGTGAAGVLQAVITYETEPTSQSYFGTGVTAGATMGNVYVSTGVSSVINSIRLVNASDLGNVSVTVAWTNGSDVVQAYLTSGFIIPKNASVEICEAPKRIPSGHKIRALASTASAISVFVSGRTQ